MFKATEIIRDYFVSKSMPVEMFDVIDKEDRSIVAVRIPIKNGGIRRMLYISTDDDNDVSLRLFQLLEDVPEEKRAAMAEAVAECNLKFRFVKFVLDSDGDVNLEFDFPELLPDEAVGKTANEMIGRVHSILEDAYPVLQRVLWM